MLNVWILLAYLLSLFFSSNLFALTRTDVNEVISAYRSVALQETKNFDKAWNELEAIIHEWYESALAISNPELEAAFTQIKQS